MGRLKDIFYSKDNRFITKCDHYLEAYERHFSRFCNVDVNVLEIGVYKGGSLQMWKKYFGDKSNIFGIDIRRKCKKLEEDRIKIFIGDQSNRDFLRSVLKEMPKIDIVIDDGGHKPNQQINSFDELYPNISENGVYLCEDLCTSYWRKYGGGFKKPDTFIEYSKNFIDYINAWHSRSKELEINDFTKSTNSIHYYDSMLFIEKRKKEKMVLINNKRIINDK